MGFKIGLGLHLGMRRRASGAPLQHYTLTAEAGIFALTGQDAALKYGRTLAADYGAFALTGQDAGLLRGYRVAADYGSFALTGQDVTLISNVAFGTAGAVNSVGSGVSPLSLAFPASIASGDMLVAVVWAKIGGTATVSTPSGWTLEGGAGTSGGAGSGVDAGSGTLYVFTKIASGSESGSQDFTINSGNVAIGRIFRYTKTGGTWSTAFTSNSQNTGNSASWAVTGSGSIDVCTGDIVIVFSGINTDAYTFSSEALTHTGVTFAAATEQQDSGTTAGNDAALVVANHKATAGRATVAPAMSMTASGSAANNPAGASAFLRLRAAA